MIKLTETDQVLTNYLFTIMYQLDIAYCYHLVNVISLTPSKSDHIRRLPYSWICNKSFYSHFSYKHIILIKIISEMNGGLLAQKELFWSIFYQTVKNFDCDKKIKSKLFLISVSISFHTVEISWDLWRLKRLSTGWSIFSFKVFRVLVEITRSW